MIALRLARPVDHVIALPSFAALAVAVGIKTEVPQSESCAFHSVFGKNWPIFTNAP